MTEKMKDGNMRPPGAAAILTALAAVIMLCAAAIPPHVARPASSQAGHDRNQGVFDGHSDLGEVEIPGRAAFDAEKQEYLLAGSGTNMWLGTDEGHFLWKRLKGDFILSARVEFIGKGVAPHRKIGWMARSTLAQDSAHVSAVVHGDGLTSVQYRKTSGQDTAEDEIGVTGPNQIQLERRGKSYIMSVAHFGETYIREQVDNIALGDEVYAGLFICSHSASVLEQARFTNVRIVTPAKDGFVPYRDYIGSRLEIMDITTKDRKVVYESPKELQAPNWTKDGRALIYNSEGLLYRFDLAAGAPAWIETGLAKSINNDHVLSFNGKRLGISNMLPDEGSTSIIYTLPVEGGKPVRATPKGPSYLHGWSPDGRTLVFTGGRNGNFDVYKIPVRGGKETRLTKSQALDDGPEYSPDGRYILFNSSRKDGMRIWRMRADGKGQRQVTADTLQDWFPHVSPDGRWIVFLSFEKDVAPEDHPFYKQVYIRIIPIDGGEARILAYVYGGQGTINVPSWSPDSKRIAFVSYSASIR